MTPERIRDISGVLTLIGFLCLLRQVYWQVRAQRRRHPRLRWYWALRMADQQTVSAFLFLSLTTIIVGQLMLSYLAVAPFGNQVRGPVSYFAWCTAVIWWSVCTERHNGKRAKQGGEGRWHPPLGSVFSPDHAVVGLREQVVGHREDVASEREDAVTEREDAQDEERAPSE